MLDAGSEVAQFRPGSGISSDFGDTPGSIRYGRLRPNNKRVNIFKYRNEIRLTDTRFISLRLDAVQKPIRIHFREPLSQGARHERRRYTKRRCFATTYSAR